MRGPFLPIQAVALGASLAAWLGLGIALLLRSRRDGRVRRRDALSLAGMALQGVGFALVFSIRGRWVATGPAEIAAAVAAVSLAAVSALLVGSSLRALGKQWSLAARVLDDHRLITTGPYALVRHPIYTGFLALLLATGAAQSRLLPTAAAAAIYLLGTLLRTSREERLLRQAFGAAYEAYAERVPALLPRGRTET